MRFGEHQRFEAKVLVDDKDVREYVDADDNTLVRVSVQCFQPSVVPCDACLGTPCSLQLSVLLLNLKAKMQKVILGCLTECSLQTSLYVDPGCGLTLTLMAYCLRGGARRGLCEEWARSG